MLTPPRPVAALFVMERAQGSPYYDLDGVDCWPERRDAMTYDGPHPVVAHPPCRLWGRFWWRAALKDGWPWGHGKGKDGGMFAHALDCVRRFGGVLEHPWSSSAWAHHGIGKDGREDEHGGRLIYVEQGWWGHFAPKATGLYIVRSDIDIPEERPTPTGRVTRTPGGSAIRKLTPPKLAQALVECARRAGGPARPSSQLLLPLPQAPPQPQPQPLG